MFLSSPKATTGGPLDKSTWGNFWFSDLPGGILATPEQSMALTPVYACVKVLAESFACMPFSMFKPSADGTKRKRITKHWAVTVFTKRPNKFQTPFEWRLMLMVHLALRGNAFCQIESNGRGEITDLLPLHPDRMSIDMLSNGDYRYKYRDDQGRTIYYTRGEIWHLRGLSSDGILGLSPIEACRTAITEGLSMQAYSNRFYQNDAKPGGGWIEVPGTFNGTQGKQDFRESWQKMQGGVNRGKVAVLEKGMKFHELQVSNTDSQFVEARAAKVSDIARIFRVPPHKIGDLARATFSNIEQQSMEFWTDTMLPWAEAWESSIEYFLFGFDSPYEVEFDMKRMMRGDSTARSAYYMNGIQWGWMTRNEAREMEGLPPLGADLDDPLVPMNMIPADMVGEDAEPAGDSAEPEPDDPAPDPAKSPAKAPVKPAAPKPKPAKGQAEAAALRAAAALQAEDTLQRMVVLVRGNAQRMARRIAAGSLPSADLLADALAVEEAEATTWLSANTETEQILILDSLLRLAGAIE